MDNIYQEAYFRKVITGTVNFLWSLPIKKASNRNSYGHVNFIIIYHFFTSTIQGGKTMLLRKTVIVERFEVLKTDLLTCQHKELSLTESFPLVF